MTPGMSEKVRGIIYEKSKFSIFGSYWAKSMYTLGVGSLSKFGKHLAKFVSIASATEQGVEVRISTDTELGIVSKL